MLKNSKYNGTEEIGLVTPTSDVSAFYRELSVSRVVDNNPCLHVPWFDSLETAEQTNRTVISYVIVENKVCISTIHHNKSPWL